MTVLLVLTLAASSLARQAGGDLRRTALKSVAPSDEIVRLDIDKDGRPDIVERWWNGKRVRWLDENGDLSATDTRGDMVNDVLQVDKNAEYHGGVKTPSPKPLAPRVEEVVKYTDTDGNGFLDTVEYDYEGDRKVDLKVSLLDYRTTAQPHPDVVPLIDTQSEGWKGLHEQYKRVADESWQEALQVYRAAWRRGLTTPETDALSFAATTGERHDHAYWLKEKVFRGLRARLQEVSRAEPARAPALEALEKELTRLYYLGLFDEYTRRIAEVPGR